MENKRLLKVLSVLTEDNSRGLELKIKQVDKKIYVIPKLSYEGKWDTVTMQFGLSTNVP